MDGSITRTLGVALVLPENVQVPTASPSQPQEALRSSAPPDTARNAAVNPVRAGREAGALQLAEWIAGDPRFRLTEVKSGATQEGARWPVRLLERLEAPALPRAARPEAVTTDGGATDVLIDLSGTAEVPDAYPYGVWRLSAFSPGAGMAEVSRGAGTTWVELTATRGSQTTLLRRAAYGTKPLAALNAAYIAEKSILMLQNALGALAEQRALPGLKGRSSDATRAADVQHHLGPASEIAVAPLSQQGQKDTALPQAELPNPPQLSLAAYAGRVAPRLMTRLSGKVLRRFGRRSSAFALRLCEGGPLDFDPNRGVTLHPPDGHFWADPFLFDWQGELFLFFEDWDPSLRRGLLQVAQVKGTQLDILGMPIRASHHLSYPFVFEAEGDVWMIPETSAAKRVELWRATDFPLGWERIGTALEGVSAADTVVFEHGGAWWLLTSIARDSFSDHCGELYLYRAEGPQLQRLEPHPLNPIVTGSTTARGAGRVWSENGRLYRASQDNSHGVYGWGLNVMEILRCDMEGYEEHRVRHVTPTSLPGVLACHHMDFAKKRVVIDASLRMPIRASNGADRV